MPIIFIVNFFLIWDVAFELLRSNLRLSFEQRLMHTKVFFRHRENYFLTILLYSSNDLRLPAFDVVTKFFLIYNQEDTLNRWESMEYGLEYTKSLGANKTFFLDWRPHNFVSVIQDWTGSK